jgi:hypothetical protein
MPDRVDARVDEVEIALLEPAGQLGLTDAALLELAPMQTPPLAPRKLGHRPAIMRTMAIHFQGVKVDRHRCATAVAWTNRL